MDQDDREPRALDDDEQAQLGRMLRAVYDEIVDEGVPARFQALIETLECSRKPVS